MKIIVPRRLGITAAICAKTHAATICVLALFASSAVGQTTLKTINNPKGGLIVYGQVDGQSTEAGAMGAVLKSLHDQYGDRPQVGKIFHVRGTDTVATFFTLVKHNQGNAQVAGLLIACKISADHVEAALLTDDAARFGTTVNQMLGTLFGLWPKRGAAPSGGGGAAAGVAALKPYSLPDHSASVSLPEGWNVSPSSGGGTILATGPAGEAVTLGYPFLAMNSNDPRVQKTMQFAQGAGRNTSYARTLYYPYGGDLGKTLVDLNAMKRKMMGLSVPSIQIANEERVPSPPSERCAHLTGKVDAGDGKGPMEMNSVFCQGPLSPMGQFMNIAFHMAVPMALADKERPTMGAILASYTVNQQVVNAQASAIAAPAIARIHAIGQAAAQQAASAHAAQDAHNRSVEERWDSLDKQHQAFSNYLLDQTVILDTQNNGHGTLWNQTADLLVKSDPNRFEYVNTPNYWKGIDY